MPTILLPERCDRAAAEALVGDFVAALGAGPITVDASKVTHVGQAMLQLLLSARRSAEGLTITSSSALNEAAALTGLAPHLFEQGDAA